MNMIKEDDWTPYAIPPIPKSIIEPVKEYNDIIYILV